MSGEYVATTHAQKLLASMDDGVVRAIITSPPYTGLPGRGSTFDAIETICVHGRHVLCDDGQIILIVGATPKNPLLPFGIPAHVEKWGGDALEVVAWYAWDRSGTMKRDTGRQTITSDFVFHIARHGCMTPTLHPASVLRTQQPGFDYGAGVTTPPDLAAYLVAQLTDEDDLIVDPFAGLGEIGVQAVHQGRRFLGSDTDPACTQLANARIANAKVA